MGNGKSNTILVNYTAIGLRIRAARKQQKMTQAELARITCLSISFIGMVERGTRKAGVESLLQIGEALHVSVDQLLTGRLLALEPAAKQGWRQRILSTMGQILDDHAEEWLP